jgi:hypothetical protein
VDVANDSDVSIFGEDRVKVREGYVKLQRNQRHEDDSGYELNHEHAQEQKSDTVVKLDSSNSVLINVFSKSKDMR